jgi:uncharacterized protein YbbC (DUF1343 family)
LVRTGLDRIAEEKLAVPGKGRVGLLTNNAAVDRHFRPSPEVVRAGGGLQLDRVFSPQHGFAGEKQDNMIESRDGVHPGTGVRLISLYGRVREPEPSMLDGLDVVLIDLPDVGTRVYTFLTTALLMLRAASRASLPVVVLDRPNPIGGSRIEGPVLREGFESFVGMIPVPLRHGLTPGEYCLYGAAAMRLDLDLRVIRMEGWRREAHQDETDVPWVMPSPNLPTLEGAEVYPGQVMLEGTLLSEGRGTTRPFELFGAPWLDPPAVRAGMEERGFLLREVAFQPTFHKFTGDTVRGFQVHVTDRRIFEPVAFTVSLLAAVRRAHPDRPLWRDPPYEYDTTKMPIDLIAGTDRLRIALDARTRADTIFDQWREEVESYRAGREPYLLYR